MDPRLRKQDPPTPRYAQPHQDQQCAIVLHFSDILLPQAQDAITNSVAVDLYCDLGIDTQQTDCCTLTFDTEEQQTVALLYCSRYDRFTVSTQ